LPYSAVLLVDPNGDNLYNCPHLYVEVTGRAGPFRGTRDRLFVKSEEIDLDDSWRRIDFFPKTFTPLGSEARIHQNEKINLDAETLKMFREYRRELDTLYAVDGRFDFLNQGDIIAVAGSAERSETSDRLLEVKHIQRCPFLEYLDDHHGSYRIREDAKRQIGREITDSEQVTILEVQGTSVSKWDRQVEP
jgi:hypothetical protein